MEGQWYLQGGKPHDGATVTEILQVNREIEPDKFELIIAELCSSV